MKERKVGGEKVEEKRWRAKADRTKEEEIRRSNNVIFQELKLKIHIR